MKRAFAITVILISIIGSDLFAAENKKTEADNLVDKSRIVIYEMMHGRDNEVPTDLIKQASGIAIIPGMIKAGFVIGGSYGKGTVVGYRQGAWTGPAFIKMGAGSLGFQIGAESVDLILVIVGQKTMDAFMKQKFKLGADVALVAGPVGAQASAASNITFKGGIYSYSRAKGAFAGVSLEGAGIATQEDLNKAYYESTDNPHVILSGKVSPPKSGQELHSVLDEYRHK